MSQPSLDLSARQNRAGRSATMAEAMSAIDDGARVYVSPICSVPTALVAAMADDRSRQGWNLS